MSTIQRENFTDVSWAIFEEDVEYMTLEDGIHEKIYEHYLEELMLAEKYLVKKRKANLTAYNKLVASVKQADYTTESYAVYKKFIDENIPDEYITDSALSTLTEQIIVAQKSLVKNKYLTVVAQETQVEGEELQHL